MNVLRSIFLLFFLALGVSVFSQEPEKKKEGTGPPSQSLRSKRKQLKAERKEARAKRKAEKAEQKMIRDHHKRIQTKKVRKRMKASKKRAKMNNENRRDPWYKRMFKMKRKV